MASFSNLAPSGKALTNPKDLGKMSFLDMSLDDIIILRKIEYPNFEEDKNETQNEGEKNSVSIQQSNAGEHRQKRVSSISRNNIKERNDKKPHQRPSGSKSQQSPLNKKSLTKKKKCSDHPKAQAEKKRSQSKENQRQSKVPQGQLEENRHYSERSRGRLEKSRRQRKKPRGQSEGSRSSPKRSHGHPERCRGHSKRSRGRSERSRGHSERSRGHSERSHGHSERSRGHSERSHGHSERSRAQSGRSRDQPRRSPEQSGRSPDQSGRYRRYLPEGRFKTSPKIEYEFDRSFIMKNRNGYVHKQPQQRNDLMNVNQQVSLKRYHSAYENYEGSERYLHTDASTTKFRCY